MTRLGNGAAVTLTRADGSQQSWAVAHSRPGLIMLEDGTCLRYAVASGANGSVIVSRGGNDVTVTPLRAQGGLRKAGQGGAATSPMNGVVTKIACAVGDKVEAGQVVMVLEAMKMENEVTAPMAGSLIRFDVQPAQTVSAGQPLFEVQP